MPTFFEEKRKKFKATFEERKKKKQINQVRRELFFVSNSERINSQLQRGDRNRCYTSCDMTQNVIHLQYFSEDTWVWRNLVVYADMVVDCAVCEEKNKYNY